MEIFWQKYRNRFRLILADEGEERELGGIRETSRGFEASAVTFGYVPGRAVKGLGSFEEAKEFVESFTPWDLFGLPRDMNVEEEIRLTEDDNSIHYK